MREDLFNRLKSRLDDIPTADQKKAYQAHQARLIATYSKMRVNTTRPAATTLPAATQPAIAEKTAPTTP